MRVGDGGGQDNTKAPDAARQGCAGSPPAATRCARSRYSLSVSVALIALVGDCRSSVAQKKKHPQPPTSTLHHRGGDDPRRPSGTGRNTRHGDGDDTATSGRPEAATHRNPKRGTSAATTRPGGLKTPPKAGRHNDENHRTAARNRQSKRAASDRERHQETTGRQRPPKRTKNTTTTPSADGVPHDRNGRQSTQESHGNKATTPTKRTNNKRNPQARATGPPRGIRRTQGCYCTALTALALAFRRGTRAIMEDPCVRAMVSL